MIQSFSPHRCITVSTTSPVVIPAHHPVIPAQAGTQCVARSIPAFARMTGRLDSRIRGYDRARWIPAFAGMTGRLDSRLRGNDGWPGEEVIHRSPEVIMDEIAALDAESAEVLLTIRGLL